MIGYMNVAEALLQTAAVMGGTPLDIDRFEMELANARETAEKSVKGSTSDQENLAEELEVVEAALRTIARFFDRTRDYS